MDTRLVNILASLQKICDASPETKILRESVDNYQLEEKCEMIKANIKYLEWAEAELRRVDTTNAPASLPFLLQMQSQLRKMHEAGVHNVVYDDTYFDDLNRSESRQSISSNRNNVQQTPPAV